MPHHIAGAVEGCPATPVVAWMKKVSHRKAPGAISAIALLVSPVNPSVACICGAFCSAIEILLEFQDCLSAPAAVRLRESFEGAPFTVRATMGDFLIS